MKNLIRNSSIAAVLAAVTLFGSCGNDDEPDVTPQAVRFTSSINQPSSVLKAANDSWAANDRIGIYMNAATSANNAVNKQYTTLTGSSAFTAIAGEDIYYPENGENVNFIAYYPYVSGLSGMDYPVTVATQTNQPAIDLLYSNNATGKNKTSGDVTLNFTHKLSKVIIKTIPGTGLSEADFAAMTMRISGVNTTATFNLSDGTLGAGGNPAPIIPLPVTIGKEYEAILLPATFTTAGDLKMEFILNNANSDVYAWKCPANETFEPGKKYTYTMTLGRTGVTFTCTITDWNNVNREGAAN